MKTTRRWLVAVAASALLVGGCTSGGDDESAADTSPTAASTEAASGDGPSDQAAKSAVDAGIDWDDPPAAIAQQTYATTTDRGNASVLVEVVRNERQGDVIATVFRITPTAEEGTQDSRSYLSWGIDTPQMLDLEELKVYTPGSGATGILGMGYLAGPFESGEPFYSFQLFGAPPASTTKVSFHLTTNGAPIPDVPIQ